MVSSPRVVEFELLVIEYALDLLESYGKQQLLKRTSLEEDLERYKKETDFKLKQIIKYNI